MFILLWFKFVFCALLVIFGANKLSKYGDILSKITGLSGIWIGIILLAIVTSLPELVTSASCIIFVKAPDLALGDIFGSNIFNLMIIGVLDFIQGSGPLLREAKVRHVLSATLGILLIAFISFGIVLNSSNFKVPSIFNMGIDALFIAILYIIGTRLVFKHERREHEAEGGHYVSTSQNRLILKFLGASSLVVVGGVWLASLGGEISSSLHISHTFVGSIFLGIVTSLPELIVCISATRASNFDMALGNILGSNLCNTTFVPLLDLLYRRAPILACASPVHLLTIILQTILTCIFVVALVYRSKKSFLKLGWGVISMVIVYFIGAWLLFKVGRS